MKLDKWDVLLLLAVLAFNGPVTWRAYKEHRCLKATTVEVQAAVNAMKPGVFQVLECIEGPRGSGVVCSVEAKDENGQTEVGVLQETSRCD